MVETAYDADGECMFDVDSAVQDTHWLCGTH